MTNSAVARAVYVRISAPMNICHTTSRPRAVPFLSERPSSRSRSGQKTIQGIRNCTAKVRGAGARERVGEVQVGGGGGEPPGSQGAQPPTYASAQPRWHHAAEPGEPADSG